MGKPNRLLVITHPVLTAIGQIAIDQAIRKRKYRDGFDHAEIVPRRIALAEEYDLEWATVAREQEHLFRDKIKPHISGREQVAYFGLAPVPLAIHLGYLVQSTTKIDVYQRHHGREDWIWAPTGQAPSRSFLEPITLPDHGSTAPGNAIIRVSTSARISADDTAKVVPQCLAAVDIALTSPDLDALETRGALDSVVDAFRDVLTGLRNLFPNLTTIHLFAAVPVGLAFRLGSQINPTMNPEVVTYQFDAKRSPRYRKAIVLGEPPLLEEAKVALNERPHWHGQELITGTRETFLDIWFLEEGLRVAQSVVRITTVWGNEKPAYGTGFVIAPNTILTNHHVLYNHKDNHQRAEHVRIAFNFEQDAAGNRRNVDEYDGNVDTVVGDVAHDWAIIRSKTPFDGKYPIIRLRAGIQVLLDDPVFIIQHPEGRTKKIGLAHNEVKHVTPERIKYLTDTLPGSSGSPVCNERWEVVALHFQGIDDLERGKRVLKNEGIHIDRVIEGLKEKGILE